jgi:hypothetical protein
MRGHRHDLIANVGGSRNNCNDFVAFGKPDSRLIRPEEDFRFYHAPWMIGAKLHM